MSNYSIKNKNKIINIKNLILPNHDNIEYKYKDIKLSSFPKLCHTYEGELTDRTRKKSFKLNQSEMCKTIRDSNSKVISKLILKGNKMISSKSLQKRNIFSKKREKNNSLNKNSKIFMEPNHIKNMLFEYSDIKPKKQKYIQINNKNTNKSKLLFKKLFQKSNNSLIKNLSRNSNILNININNNSFKTNISNTFTDNEINNYTQRNTYFENQKLIPLFIRRTKDNYLNLSKNKNSKNIEQWISDNCYRNRNINSKLKENLNLFRTYNNENRINSNKSKNKRIHLLIKKEKKSLNKTLPYREKLLKDIKNDYISKNKIKFKNPNIKKINLVKKTKINNINPNINNNTIYLINKPEVNAQKKIKEKNLQKKTINEKIIQNNKEPIIKTKKLIFSPTLPKTKENTITIKDIISKKVSKIDSCTLAGYTSSGEKKINQDNFFIEKNFLDEKDQFFIGICDGHGEQGHLISSYISKCLPNFLADTSDKSIISSFISLNQNIVQNSKIDCSLSGSTCTSIILNQEKIISLNLGDSRTVLARNENGKYIAVNLSTDHKPNIKEERKRILINGGRIKPFYDDKTKKFIGTDRIWIREDDLPGLAMTRSFGDIIAHSVGVISQPEIKRYGFNGNEKFIILASDGIWEYITSQECVNIIKDFYEKNLDAIGAIHYIMNEAFNRWKKYDEIIDDITIILIFFEPN